MGNRPMTARAPPPKAKKPEIVHETVLMYFLNFHYNRPLTAILKDEGPERDNGSFLALEVAGDEIPVG